MKKISDQTHLPLNIGDSAIVSIPDVDKGKADLCNVLGVILEVTSEQLYKIGTRNGILDKLYCRYTGHCPEFKYRIGNTYGSTTHKILLDPSVQHSERLVLSDRTADDFQVFRPPQTDIDTVNARFRNGDPVYKHPMIPGYEGFLPRLNAHFGQRYTVSATEGLSEFQKLQLNQRAARRQLERVVDLQAGKGQPWDLVDRFSATAEFKLPLVVVRPECAGILRDLPMDEPKLSPASHSVSPYFMENGDPEKYITKGFAGHVPYGFQRFGESSKKLTNSALCDFSSNYRRRQSTEWAPVNVVKPDPPMSINPTEIYHKHVGLLPSYAGHVPGSMFRFGKTYGNDTRDAKRWLRGDFSP